MYHGPIQQTLDFFSTMGFQCPERKGVADFLQEVTSRNDQQVCVCRPGWMSIPAWQRMACLLQCVAQTGT